MGHEIVFEELKCSDESSLLVDSSQYDTPRADPMSFAHGIPLGDGPSENSDWVPLVVSSIPEASIRYAIPQGVSHVMYIDGSYMSHNTFYSVFLANQRSGCSDDFPES